jgi:hypothetical protein
MAGVKRHFVKLKVFLRSHFVAVPETLAECPADQPLVASSASPLTHTLSRSRTSPLGRIDQFALPSGTTTGCAQGTAGVDVKRALRIAAMNASIGRVARQRRSPREGPESGRKPAFRCEQATVLSRSAIVSGRLLDRSLSDRSWSSISPGLYVLLNHGSSGPVEA